MASLHVIGRVEVLKSATPWYELPEYRRAVRRQEELLREWHSAAHSLSWSVLQGFPASDTAKAAYERAREGYEEVTAYIKAIAAKGGASW